VIGDGGFPPSIGGSGGAVMGDGGGPPTGGTGGGLSASADGGTSPTPGASPEPGVNDSALPTNHWRDTGARHLTRSQDLPLHDPPPVVLRALPEGRAIRVRVEDAGADTELSWDGPGRLDFAGGETVWTPASPSDRLTVVLRRPGGVASASLLASDYGQR
jgi:hypothetical protein